MASNVSFPKFSGLDINYFADGKRTCRVAKSDGPGGIISIKPNEVQMNGLHLAYDDRVQVLTEMVDKGTLTAEILQERLTEIIPTLDTSTASKEKIFGMSTGQFFETVKSTMLAILKPENYEKSISAPGFRVPGVRSSEQFSKPGSGGRIPADKVAGLDKIRSGLE